VLSMLMSIFHHEMAWPAACAEERGKNEKKSKFPFN
jgi:hypothetical protein